LYGLKEVTLVKGATAIGARLTIDQLRANYLVVLSIDGNNHFEVIQNITDTTVYLFDPNLGNIEMTRDKFNELYTGIALIINDQPPVNATLLTPDEMRDIKAMWHKVKIGAWYEPPHFVIAGWKKTYYSFSIPIIHVKWVSVYRWGPINIGYWSASVSWKTITIGIWTPVFRYVPGRWHNIYVTVPDVKVTKMMSEKQALDNAVIRLGTLGAVLGIFVPGLGEAEVGSLAFGASATTTFLSGLSIGYNLDTVYHAFNDPYVVYDIEGIKYYSYC